MAAAYPGGTYSPRTKENQAGVVYDASKKTTGYAEDIVKLDEEVVAIETELGTDASGIYATVKAWLTALTAAIVTTFTGLTDTPANYAGQAGKYLKVNAVPDALEFTDPPAGGFNSRARAHLSANQTIASANLYKINLNVEDYDGNSEFDHVTNYRFTAKVTGYYSINIQVIIQGTGAWRNYEGFIFKNGNVYNANHLLIYNVAQKSLAISDILYLEVGDYIELYARQDTGSDKLVYATGADGGKTFIAIHRLS